MGFPNAGGLCSVSQAGPQTPDTELAFISESGRWVSFRWVLDVWPPPWGLPGGDDVCATWVNKDGHPLTSFKAGAAAGKER